MLSADDNPTVTLQVSAPLSTTYGDFVIQIYNADDDKEHIALVYGDVENKEGVLLRMHSECFTGDVLGSVRCDCAEQLHYALEMIAGDKQGILLYLRQEGRGIGLVEKLKSYNLQEEGHDTVDANLLLGHQADGRDYHVAVAILKKLNPKSVRVLTNNPRKIEAVKQGNITVQDRLPIIPRTLNRQMRQYLKTKAERLHHIIDFEGFGSV